MLSSSTLRASQWWVLLQGLVDPVPDQRKAVADGHQTGPLPFNKIIAGYDSKPNVLDHHKGY